MAIKLPTSSTFSKNRDRYPYKDNEYNCVVCGKPIRMEPEDRPWMLRVINGGRDVATTESEDEIDPAGDLYGLPIGADCLRRHPKLKEWAKR